MIRPKVFFSKYVNTATWRYAKGLTKPFATDNVLLAETMYVSNRMANRSYADYKSRPISRIFGLLQQMYVL